MKPVVIQSIVDDMDSVIRNTKKFLNVPGGILADRNNRILSMRELADHDLSVEHSRPIIFFPDMERRQVVNGGDARTRSGPDHAAVARNMDQIQTVPMSQSRKVGLMPDDI